MSLLTTEDWTDAGGGNIYAFEYGYDGAGNRTRRSLGASHTYYQYDETNRLLHAHEVPAGTATYYSYDPRGNTTQIEQLGAHTTYFEYNDRDLIRTIHYGETGAWNYFHYDARPGFRRRYAFCKIASESVTN